MQEVKENYQNEYLNDSYLFNIKTNIVKFEQNEKDENLINLYFQNTVFHPQGGGQPSDEGEIIIQEGQEEKKLQVQSLEFNRDLKVVIHKVKKEEFDALNLKIGQEVQLKINEEKRKIFARLHSGGHLLDMAVSKLKLNWQPGKGYHFEKNPYVEYFGELEQEKFDTISEQITEICTNFIKESKKDEQVQTQTFKYEEAKKIMKVPDYIPEGMDFRYVRLLPTDEGCPCGGTHVKHIGDIERVIVTKIKANKNKKTVTVYYSINPVEVQKTTQQQQKQKKQKQPKEKKNQQNNKVNENKLENQKQQNSNQDSKDNQSDNKKFE